MAERQRIGVPISGLDTSTPDHSVADGKCETLHNLRYTGGAWRNVKPFTSSPELPDLEGTIIAYHHPADEDDAFITYDVEIENGAKSYIFNRSTYRLDYNDWARGVHLVTIEDYEDRDIEEVFQVSHFGNMLIIGDNITKTIHYFFLTTANSGGVTYQRVNFEEMSVNITFSVPYDEAHITKDTFDEDGLACCTVSGADKQFAFRSTRPKEDTWKHFRGEFLMVAALVTEEGEIIKLSPFRVINTANEIEKVSTLTESKGRQKAYKTLRYANAVIATPRKDTSDNLWIISNYPSSFFFCQGNAHIECGNIVAGSRVAYVDIYTTRLYNLLEFENEEEWGDNTINIFEEPMYRMERRRLADISQDDDGNYIFDYEIKSTNFDNIDQRVELELSQGADDIYGKVALEYNNRLHLSNVHTKIKIGDLTDYIEEGRGGYNTVLAKLSYDGLPYWSKREFEVDKTLLFDSSILFALEGNYEALYISGSVKRKIPMRHSAPYNTSFGYVYSDIITDESKHLKVAKSYDVAYENDIYLAPRKYKRFSELEPITSLPNISPNVLTNEIYTPNAVRVSAANIPYTFPFANSYRIGSNHSEVIAMQSAALNLSDSKFGEMPVYVFTNEGVWAMQSGAEVVYSSIVPINEDVVISPNTLAVNNSILYITDKGLNLLSPQGKVNISRDINDSNNRTPQWLRDAKMVSLPEWNEVMLCDTSAPLIYVYSLDNNVWSTRSMPKGYVINSGELVADEGRIYNLRNEVESFDSNALSMLHPSASAFSLMRSAGGDDTAKYKWVCDWGVLKRSGDEDRQITLYDYDEELEVVCYKSIYAYRPTTPTSSLTRYRFKANVRAKLDAFDPRELIFIVADDGFIFGDNPFGAGGYPEEPRFRNVEVYTPDGSLLTTLSNLEIPGTNTNIDTRHFYDNYTPPNVIDKLQYGMAFAYETWDNYNDRIRLYPSGYHHPYYPDGYPDSLVTPPDDVWNDVYNWFNTYYADDDRIIVDRTLYFDEDDSLLHYAFNGPLAPDGAEDPYVVCVYNNGLGDIAYRCTQEEQDKNDNPFDDHISVVIDDDSTEGGGNEGGDSSHSIVLSQTSIDVPYESGDYSVAVESTCSWSASSNANWVSVNTPNGFEGNNTLSFSVETNSANSTREAIITLNNSEYDVSAQLLVVQAAYNQGGNGDNEGGGNEGGDDNEGGGLPLPIGSIALKTRPIKLGSMELKRAETIIVRFECPTKQTLNVKVGGSIDTQNWKTLRKLKGVQTNKDIIIRRTPCSVKYLRFAIDGNVTDDIRILAFELEYYNRWMRKMR